jgi:hypothetical protein
LHIFPDAIPRIQAQTQDRLELINNLKKRKDDFLQKKCMKGHFYHPRDSESRDRTMVSMRPAWVKLARLHLRNKRKKQKGRGVA